MLTVKKSIKNQSHISSISFLPEGSKIINFLFSTAILLIILSIAVNAGLSYEIFEDQEMAHKVKSFFNLDAEFNLPTVFSFFILLISSLFLYVIYLAHRSNKNKHFRLWGLLALIFLFIGLDEILVIHEKIALIFGKLFEIKSSIRYYLWVIPYTIPILFFGYLFYPFLLSLPKKHRLNFMIAASLFLGGGYIVEIIGAWHRANYGYGFIHSLIFTLEESMEIMGIIFFIKSLIQYWHDEIKYIQFSLFGVPSNQKESTKESIVIERSFVAKN